MDTKVLTLVVIMFSILLGCAAPTESSEFHPTGQVVVSPEVVAATQPAVSPTAVLRTITLESGEQLQFPLEAFEEVLTQAAGLNSIQVVKNPAGEVEYFLLDKEGYWVTPIELQTDPQNPENYTRITPEDVRRARYTVALNLEPFPVGTAIPDAFIYRLWSAPKGKWVDITPFFNSTQYPQQPSFQEMVNIDNDYRDWKAFYKIVLEDGTELNGGHQAMVAPDGNVFLWLYGWGEELPTDRDFITPGGDKVNLIDSVFGLDENTFEEGYLPLSTAPTIFWRGITPEKDETFFGFIRQGGYLAPTGGAHLYQEEGNDPVAAVPGLETMIDAALENPEFRNGGNLGEANLKDLIPLQDMILLGHGNGRGDHYFNP